MSRIDSLHSDGLRSHHDSRTEGDELIHRELRGHTRVLEHLARGAPLCEVLTMLVEFAEETRSGMFASVQLLDRRTGQLHHGSASSLPPDYRDAIDGVVIGPSVGSCGTATFSK